MECLTCPISILQKIEMALDSRVVIMFLNMDLKYLQGFKISY